MKRPSKYNATRVEIDGHSFPSKREAKRYGELKILLAGGLIQNLELQPKFPIIINGVKVCTYIADFSYFTDKERVIEDAKGFLTPMYRIKKKLMAAVYPGVKIVEV